MDDSEVPTAQPPPPEPPAVPVPSTAPVPSTPLVPSTAPVPSAPVSGAPVPSGTAVDPLALLARGDRKGAITALMDQHGTTVFNFCCRFLLDRVLAEDVLQQVFLHAYRDIDRFEGRSSPRTWLLRIAVHRCQDAIKARNRQRVSADSDAIQDAVDPGRIADEHVETSRLVRALEECLEALPRDVRATVLLRFHSGCSYREMAGHLEASAEALQARVSRALPTLRRCLEDKGWADG